MRSTDSLFMPRITSRLSPVQSVRFRQFAVTSPVRYQPRRGKRHPVGACGRENIRLGSIRCDAIIAGDPLFQDHFESAGAGLLLHLQPRRHPSRAG